MMRDADWIKIIADLADLHARRVWDLEVEIKRLDEIRSRLELDYEHKPQ